MGIACHFPGTDDLQALQSTMQMALNGVSVQTKAINETLGNDLKSLALILQVAIHFYPSRPQPKTLVNSFSAQI